MLNRKVPLEQVKKNGEVVSSYVYDPNGFRVEKQGSKGKIHYVPLLNGEVGYRKEFTSGKEYSWVYVGSQKLARVNGTIGSEGHKYFFHNDTLGTALAVTDENGNKVVERDFTPFGERINTDVYDDEPRDANEDESGFTGKDFDQDIGLYYFNARWYDPEIGRFTSEDSLNDGQNPYSYCGNNPVNFTDPTGHFKIDVLGGALGLAVQNIPGLGAILSGANAFGLFVGKATKNAPAGSFWEKVGNLVTGNGFKTDKAVAANYDKKIDQYKKDYIEKNGQAAWDVLNYTAQQSGMSVGQYMAKNNLNFKTVSDHLVKYYSDKQDARRDMVASLGVDYFVKTTEEYGEQGNAKETLAYTADVVSYLAHGNKDQFVNDLFYAFNSTNYPSPRWLNEAFTNPNFRTQNINWILMNDPRFEGRYRTTGGLPFSGFKEKYRDQVSPNWDQAHHFVAFVRFGHIYTDIGGQTAALAIEAENGFRNWNDIKLAFAGVKAAYDNNFWSNPGQWIRRNL